MSIITIPKQTIAKDDLVIVPRKEYETLLHFRNPLIKIKEVTMTKPQKLALQKARKNLALGKYLTIHELKHKLGIKN